MAGDPYFQPRSPQPHFPERQGAVYEAKQAPGSSRQNPRQGPDRAASGDANLAGKRAAFDDGGQRARNAAAVVYDAQMASNPGRQGATPAWASTSDFLPYLGQGYLGARGDNLGAGVVRPDANGDVRTPVERLDLVERPGNSYERQLASNPRARKNNAEISGRP